MRCIRNVLGYVAVSLLSLLLLGASGCSPSAVVAEEKDAIAKVLHQTFDRPSAELLVEPIVIRQEYAVADWTSGESGGRSVLHREHGAWKVLVTGGVEVRDAEVLARAGVKQPEASALVNTLIGKERQVPEERLAKLDRYAASDATATTVRR